MKFRFKDAALLFSLLGVVLLVEKDIIAGGVSLAVAGVALIAHAIAASAEF